MGLACVWCASSLSLAGIAQNIRDIECLLSVVDSDTSGGIDFEEFLLVLQPQQPRTSARVDHAKQVSSHAFSALQVLWTAHTSSHE